MTVQSARKTVAFNGEMSRSHTAAGEPVRAMLTTVRDVLLAKDVARHTEQSDADLARQQAERRREAMSWELHGLHAGDVASDRHARTR